MRRASGRGAAARRPRFGESRVSDEREAESDDNRQNSKERALHPISLSDEGVFGRKGRERPPPEGCAPSSVMRPPPPTRAREARRMCGNSSAFVREATSDRFKSPCAGRLRSARETVKPRCVGRAPPGAHSPARTLLDARGSDGCLHLMAMRTWPRGRTDDRHPGLIDFDAPRLHGGHGRRATHGAARRTGR